MKAPIQELIKGYIQKAENKAEVAVKLFKSGDYEDAVSRAYYAVFHAAQALLLTEGHTADTHKGVVTLFGLFFVKTGKFAKHIGKYLATLKDDRESVDYEIFSYIDEDSAQTAIAEAQEFLSHAKQYLHNSGFI